MHNKWWEYYAVRYFVGTVIGAGVIAFLNFDTHSPFKCALAFFGEFKDSTFKGVSLFAAIGFAFCYVASAPVLLLHATRQHMRITSLTSKPFLKALLLLACVAGSIWLAYSALPIEVAWAIGSIFGVQVALVLSAVLTGFSPIERFYRQLATARALEAPSAPASCSPSPPKAQVKSEYVTSYRHLREHGNAFVILLLEAALAISLYKLRSPNYAFPLLVAYVTPASFVWLVGTALESRLARNHEFP